MSDGQERDASIDDLRRRILKTSALGSLGLPAMASGAADAAGGGTSRQGSTRSVQAVGADCASAEGVAFCDDWSDGNYREDPPWRKYRDEGDFSATVAETSDPDRSETVLRVSETTGGGTLGQLGWEQPRSGWDGSWQLSGRFYVADATTRLPFQAHNLFAALDPNDQQTGIRARLGVTTGDGPLRPISIGGPEIETEEETTTIPWVEDTWFDYEWTHDGEGTYELRLWEEGTDRPDEPQAVSTGEPIEHDGVAGVSVNGARRADLTFEHAAMRWTRDPTGTYYLKQGGTTEEIRPVSYEDLSIDQFYDASGSPSGQFPAEVDLLRADTSQAFLYEGPDGLSLVQVHDSTAGRDSGGALEFSYSGLPSDGSWVVKDGSERFDDYSRTATAWSWGPGRTDGGAYRDLGGEFTVTITPESVEGIDRFTVITADPDDPTSLRRIEVDESPFTISSSRGDGCTALESALETKQNDSIDPIRAAVPDQYVSSGQRVDAAARDYVEELRGRRQSGLSQVACDQYSRSIERLIDAERVTLRAVDDDVLDLIGKAASGIIQSIISIVADLIPIAGARFVRLRRAASSTVARKGDEILTTTQSRLPTRTGDDVSEIVEAAKRDIERFNAERPPSVFHEAYEDIYSNTTNGGLTALTNGAQILGTLNSEYDWISEINGLFGSIQLELETAIFQRYWFTRQEGDLLDTLVRFVETASVPEEPITYTVPLPDFIENNPLVSVPQVEFEVEVPAELRDAINGRLDTVETFVTEREETLRSICASGGGCARTPSIEESLSFGIDDMKAQIDDDSFPEQSESDRDRVVEDSIEAFDETVDVTNDVYGTLSAIELWVGLISGILALAALIIFVAAAAGGITAPVGAATLITYAGYVGVVATVLTVLRTASAAVAIDFLTATHASSTEVISNAEGNI